jgi:PAS domain S-box-containing protein
MPAVRSRRVLVALYIALVVLALPLVLTVSELETGGGRAQVRLAILISIGALLLFVVMRMHGLVTKIVEQEQVDERLRASEAKFSGILAIAADAIITVDEAERIVHFNEGAAAIFGYPVADALGKPLSMLIPPRVRDVHHRHMRQFAESPVAARRMGERREINGVRRDGTEFPAEASISKLRGPDGMLFTVVLRDVTERRRAQEDERFLSAAATEVARSLEYATVLQTIAHLVVPRLADGAVLDVIQPDGSIRRAAGADAGSPRDLLLREIANTGVTWESPSPIIDVIRRRTAQLFTDVDDDWIEAHEELIVVPAWRTVGAHQMYVMPLSVGDRALGALTLLMIQPKRTFNSDSLALADKFAQPVALALVNAELYRAAQRANSAREEVLGVVSHDLRNPLSAIAMCARVLHEAPPADRGESDNLLLTISESVEAMNRLIQDLVDVASIERGQLSLERAPTTPARLVDRAMHMFAVEARDHGIAFEKAVATDLPELTVDESRIVQVLSNLIRNAIKFTPDSGRIDLAARASDGGVMFSVTDSGAGIDPSLHQKIFDRYWERADGARKRGTGLGLSIARGIVVAHGGRIGVRSEPGKGSEFYFWLPVSSP